MKEGDEIDALIDMYLNDDEYEYFEATIIVDVELKAIFDHLVYDKEYIFSIPSFYLNSSLDFMSSIDQNGIYDVMDDAVAMINRDIDDCKYGIHIIGIQNINFKPIATED